MGETDVQLASSEGAANDGATNTAALDLQSTVLRLYESELELVAVVARRIGRALGSFDQLDDLLASGREGLFDAARRFDPARGVPFKSYANIRIQGTMLDFVRKSAQLPRRAHERLKTLEAATTATAGTAAFVLPSAGIHRDACDLEDLLLEQVASVTTAMAVAVSVPTADGASGFEGEPLSDPEDATARAELVLAVRNALSELDADELAIVKLTFFEDMNLREAAEHLRMNKSWAFRVKTRALERLTKVLWPLRAEA